MLDERKLVRPMDYQTLMTILLRVMDRLNKDKVDLDVKLHFSRELLRGNTNG